MSITLFEAVQEYGGLPVALTIAILIVLSIGTDYLLNRFLFRRSPRRSIIEAAVYVLLAAPFALLIKGFIVKALCCTAVMLGVMWLFNRKYPHL